MYIVLYNPEDDYHHRDESWEVYDTENFNNFTKEGFEDFITEMEYWNIKEIYTDKSKLPAHLLHYGSDSVTWYDWDNEKGWEQRDLKSAIEDQRKRCNHDWGYPDASLRASDGEVIEWTRKCKQCGHTETTSKSKVSHVEKYPVF